MRRSRLKARSASRIEEDEAWRDVKMAVMARDRHRCQAEALWSEVACGGPLDVHHIAGRRSREDRLSLDGLILLCRQHHDHAHLNPREARAVGLLR